MIQNQPFACKWWIARHYMALTDSKNPGHHMWHNLIKSKLNRIILKGARYSNEECQLHEVLYHKFTLHLALLEFLRYFCVDFLR